MKNITKTQNGKHNIQRVKYEANNTTIIAIKVVISGAINIASIKSIKP